MEFKIQNDVQNLKCFPNLSFFRNGWYNHEIKAITTVVPKAHGEKIKELILIKKIDVLLCSVKVDLCSSE